MPSEGGRGTSGEIAARNAEIARLRATGLTWGTIATEVGLDERNVRRGFADHVAVEGEHSMETATALHDLLAMLDKQIENAVRVYEASSRNRNAQIGAVRVALRGLTAKASVLATAGVIGEEGVRWQADRSFFREFVGTGIRLLGEVEAGEITADAARDRFAEAMDLLERDGARRPGT